MSGGPVKPPAAEISYETRTLEGGTRLVCAPIPHRGAVSIGVWVSVGGRHESAPVSGISHFLEHLVFKGTTRRSAYQIKEEIEGRGGSLNAFTSEEHTCFLAKIGERHFERAFDVLCDLVRAATLRQEDIDKERTVILEEIKMTQDQPAQLADEVLAGLVWPRHPLGRPLAGTESTVSALGRRQLCAFRDRHYVPSRLVVVASGAIRMDRLARAASLTLESGRASAGPKPPAPFLRAQRRPLFKVVHKKTEQTHLAMGVHAMPKNHPDAAAQDLLSVILGGNMSSRLFNEVREERGLAYEIGTFSRKYRETGGFFVEAGVDAAKTVEAADVILEQLARVRREPVTAGELERAKEFYLGQLSLSLENSMDVMLWAGDSMTTLGRIRTVGEVVAAAERARAEDLTRVARRIFADDRLSLAVVGPLPKRESERLRRRLVFQA